MKIDLSERIVQIYANGPFGRESGRLTIKDGEVAIVGFDTETLAAAIVADLPEVNELLGHRGALDVAVTPEWRAEDERWDDLPAVETAEVTYTVEVW